MACVRLYRLPSSKVYSSYSETSLESLSVPVYDSRYACDCILSVADQTQKAAWDSSCRFSARLLKCVEQSRWGFACGGGYSFCGQRIYLCCGFVGT